MAEPESAPAMRWTLVLGLAGLVYGLIGWLSSLLTVPLGLATPIDLHAGVALVLVLAYGWRVLPVVMVAAWVLNASLHSDRGWAADPWWVAACIGLGAAAQATAGWAFVRRWVHHPLVLTEPRDIALFFGLGGAAACTLSATIVTVTLWVAHVMPASTAGLTWITWWLGNTLGVMVVAPVALTLIGQPRADWAQRRLILGLSFLAACFIFAASIRQTVRDDAHHVEIHLGRDAARVQTELNAALAQPLNALIALQTAYGVITTPSEAAHRLAAAPWLERPEVVQALGWAERVTARDGTVLEPGGQSGGQGGVAIVTDRYVTTTLPTVPGLGPKLLSLSGTRQAIADAVRGGTPVAITIAQPLAAQLGAASDAVLVFRAVYAGEPRDEPQRLQMFRGVVWALLQPDVLLASLKANLPTSQKLCLGGAIGSNHSAISAPGLSLAACPPASTRQLQDERPIRFAQQTWNLQLTADTSELPATGHFGFRALGLVALLLVALLGALLLNITGRARRFQMAVTERTHELLREIQARDSTEARLRESEALLSNILDNLPLGVVYTNLEGNLKQVNARFSDLLGYSHDELMQINTMVYTHPDDVAPESELITQLLNDQIPLCSVRKRLKRKDGQWLWVGSTLSLLRDFQGRPRRIVAVVEDITEHLRLAEADKAREAAETSNQAKSVFLSRMSHELRTPLNAMLGFAQLLELDNRHRLPDSQRTWVAQIQKAGWHLLNMINDVMDLSRIESGNLRLQDQTLDVFELLAGTLPLIEGEARRQGVSITHHIAPAAGLVRGDATRVKQILTNLLTNAVKYNVEGGRIHIATRQRAGMVDVTVTDTGLGLSAEQMAELFQPFNRLGRDRSSIEGTGIGLVISQRLAEWMGGNLRARSTLGQGSEFTLSLPQVDATDTVRSDLDHLPNTLSTYNRRRVHYVEDNETNVEVMRGILAQRGQIELTVSLTGLDGLVAIRTLSPDVILLDVHLPDISGMELLRHLRNDARTASIPVIMVSADALNAQAEEALSLGALRYLTKPVNIPELLGLLDDILMETDTVFE